MKVALMVTPLDERNLRLAAQVGVEEMVVAYPGPEPGALARTCRKVDSTGLRVSVVERHIPHDLLVHRLPGWERQRDAFVDLIGEMGRCGVETLCYNWMPEEDWQRTSMTARERGGALVTEFDLAAVEQEEAETVGGSCTPREALWDHLEGFLAEVIPVAEDCGVRLAMHPDDPPLPALRGQDRILGDFAAFERLLDLHPSPCNGICYCQGSFASAGEDVVAGIHRFAGRIHFVHFRDVAGTVPRFRETFQDNGPTDMAAAVRAYREIGFAGPARPDHVPTLEGERNEHPGYEMQGRLWAVGYMRGLLDACRPGGEIRPLPPGT